MKEKYTKNIFLSLGSNLGDRQHNISEAIKLIEDRMGPIEKQSSLYDTQAWGKQDQEPYLNCIIQVSSLLSPVEILNAIHSIESSMGRIRDEKWGPRTIDIDIIYFNDSIIKTDGLEVPHPWMNKRKFVLAPLGEIAPDFVHPVLNKTSIQLLNECDDSSKIKRIKD